MESSEGYVRKSNFYYVGCYFVCISSVLGTGILALPVKTASSGFAPFFVILMIVLFMSEATVIYAVEVMQKAHSLIHRGVRNYEVLIRGDIPQEGDYASESLKGRSEEERLITSTKGHVEKEEMNLHMLGALFLPRSMRIIFDLCVYLHFISVLISYILAASEAWGEIVGVKINCQDKHVSEDLQNKLRIVIAIFGTVATLMIIFGQRVFTSVVSMLTAVKGTLLIVMVAVVAYVAVQFDVPIHNSFKHMAESFLMCTVALGGVVAMLPMLFNSVPQRRSEIQKFRLSVILAMITCALLITLWTYFVMKVVPQRDDPLEPSLAGANENGCISTIPLTTIIRDKKASLVWIAWIVEVFILVSVSVSYLTVGSGMKNFLDAYIRIIAKKARLVSIKPSGKIVTFVSRVIRTEVFFKVLVYVISYGAAVGFALGKPKCFLVMLEYFSSAGLNLENGLFISYMYITATIYYDHPIPLPIPRLPGLLSAWITGCMFFGAVLYSVTMVIVNSVKNGTLC